MSVQREEPVDFSLWTLKRCFTPGIRDDHRRRKGYKDILFFRGVRRKELRAVRLDTLYRLAA